MEAGWFRLSRLAHHLPAVIYAGCDTGRAAGKRTQVSHRPIAVEEGVFVAAGVWKYPHHLPAVIYARLPNCPPLCRLPSRTQVSHRRIAVEEGVTDAAACLGGPHHLPTGIDAVCRHCRAAGKRA